MKRIDPRVLALSFFVLAIILRFLPHPPGFAPVAAMALFAGCYISGVAGIILAVGAMVFSDAIGHMLNVPGIYFYDSLTMVTVYLAFAASALVGRGLRGRVSHLSVPVASLAASAVFFLSTNFASWLDPMMEYPQTLSGLVSCYVRAIPFYRNAILGDLFYSALMFGGYALLLSRSQVPSVVRSQA
jgi:hypothetical protein